MASKGGFSPVTSGYDPRTEPKRSGDGESSPYLSIKDGESVDVVVLVDKKELLKFDQCAIWLEDGKNSPVWVYTGEDDPSHELGVDRRYRAILPVYVNSKDHPAYGESKIWSMGKQSHEQILEIADAGTRLAGTVIRIKRTGVKLKTKYNILPLGKRKDVSGIPEVDVLSLLGPLTSDGVRELIAEKFGKDSYEEFLESYTGNPSKGSTVKASPKKASPKKAALPDVEEEVEELELEDSDE
jgi:hypothetical protein